MHILISIISISETILATGNPTFWFQVKLINEPADFCPPIRQKRGFHKLVVLQHKYAPVYS
jgi:hypothetical protein